MKVLLVLATIVVLATALDKQIAEEMRAKMLEKLTACASEVGATPDDLATLKTHTIPETREGKCTIFCMHKQFNIQDPSGAITLSAGLEVLEILKDLDMDFYNAMATAYNKCGGVAVDSDACVTAANWANCVIVEGKALDIEKYIVD